MRRPLKVHGLDCASCGSKIEDAVSKMDGINNANLNFMTLKLTIDFDDRDKLDGYVKEISEICDSIEPGCSVSL